MPLSPIMDWTLGAIGVAGVLWTLVKSVRVKVNVRVRKITPEDTGPAGMDEPKFSFEKHVQVEHGKLPHFGTRTAPPG